jgi:hypothetical protein
MILDGMIPDITWPRWAVMWAIAFGVFGLAKLLSYWPARKNGATAARINSYFLAWPGLDAGAFLAPANQREKTTTNEWCFGALKLGIGVGLLFLGTNLVGTADDYLVGWIGMLGVVFTLHFGLFHLLSCFWRSQGVNAPPLMDWPILSKSVSEFWGKRWNRAFRDLTHRFVFRPLTSHFGLAMGSLLAFLFSGLIHELVITVPAGGGYGGPTIYFLIQGAGLLLERSKTGRRMGLGSLWPGRLFAGAVLVAPVGLLFPRPFVVEVVVPFLMALGSIT